MNLKEKIRFLENKREQVKEKAYAIQRKKDGVPPLKTWINQFLEGVGGMFRDSRDEIYIKNLEREIAKTEEYIRKFG